MSFICFKKFKRHIKRNKKGQALLMVMVISTLTLLMILSASSRLLSTLFNIQRATEFDRAVAVAENRVNQIMGMLSNRGDAVVMGCLSILDRNLASSAYINLSDRNECSFLNEAVSGISPHAKLLGRRVNNSSISLTPSQSVSIKLSDNMTKGQPTRRVTVRCSSNAVVVVTRVFVGDNGILSVDKGVLKDCNEDPNRIVNLYSYENNYLRTNSLRQNTLYISVRYVSSTPGASNVSIKVDVLDNFSNVIASTDKYEFVVSGVGGEGSNIGTGSDVLIHFETGAGSTYVNDNFLDYVYYETP